MGIEYSPANNKFSVTGYSALTPCNFTDLWTEDKAGTLDLMPATLPAMNMTLTTQIKPSDEVALKIDFILAGSGAGAGDTIDITGTDKDGNAQSETLTTEADGTFTTTKWFTTITDIDCNGFNSGTLTVRQNQWGVVWKNGDSQFIVKSELLVGDGSTVTWFADTNKQIVIDRGSNTRLFVHENANFRLGEKDANGNTHNGCSLAFLNPPSGYGALFGAIRDGSYYVGNIYLYDSIFSIEGFWRFYKDSGEPTIEMINCIVQKWKGCRFQGTNSILKDLTIHDGISFGITTKGALCEVSNIKVFRSYCGIYFASDHSMTNAVISQLKGKNNTYFIYMKADATNYDLYLINSESDSWSFKWDGSGDCLCYRQYTFNLKVIDKDGNGIGNATVILKDKDGNTADQKGFSTATSDADATRGEITEQIVSYGYYNQANGNTLQSYSPHTLEIKKAGKLIYKKQFTLDEKINWRIKLDPGTTMDLSGNLFKKITPSSMVRL